MAPNEPHKLEDLKMPDTTGKNEGATWKAWENGVEVTYSIPVGNGNQSVDRTWTNSEGGTSTNRMVDDGSGGFQSWTDSTNGPAVYVNKGEGGTTNGLYGQVYDPETSTSSRPDVVFGGNANLSQVEAVRYDGNGNPVSLLNSSRNARGNWNSLGVDDQGNRTLFGDLPDGKGGFISGSLVGQINPEGYGWSTDTTGARWNVAPDPSGDPGGLLRWRTESAKDGGTLAIYVDSHGVEKREHRGKESDEVLSVEFFDLDGTRTYFDAKENTKATFNPQDRTLTVVERDGETTVFGDDGEVKNHKLAPGTIDVPGLIDKAIDTVYFWNPVQRGADKAAAHAVVGLGGLLGWYDEYGRTLNLPTQQETLSGFGDMALQMGTEFLYLQGNFKDAQGNTIWSPDGKLDKQHAILNAYNNLAILSIGTDLSNFKENPGETIGSALFGIGSLFAPGPKGLSALGEGARFGGILDDAGRFGVRPHYPDIELPDIGGSPHPHVDGETPAQRNMPNIGGAPHQDGSLPELGVAPHPHGDGASPSLWGDDPEISPRPDRNPADVGGTPYSSPPGDVVVGRPGIGGHSNPAIDGVDPRAAIWEEGGQFGQDPGTRSSWGLERRGGPVPPGPDGHGTFSPTPRGGFRPGNGLPSDQPASVPPSDIAGRKPPPGSTGDLVLQIDEMYQSAEMSESEIIAAMAGKGLSDEEIRAVVGASDKRSGRLLLEGQWIDEGGFIREGNGNLRNVPGARLPGGTHPTTVAPVPPPTTAEMNALENATTLTDNQRTGMRLLPPNDKSPWRPSELGDQANAGAVGGRIGERLTRQKLLDDQYVIIAEGAEARIPIPGQPGKFFEPDFIVLKDGEVHFVESKWGSGKYTRAQVEGYGVYQKGRPLEIDSIENPTIQELIRENNLDPDSIQISGVRTIRWNMGWEATDDLVWKAANEPWPYSLVRKDGDWNQSLYAFTELNREAARRATAANNPAAYLYFRARSDALEAVQALTPSDSVVRELLVNAVDTFSQRGAALLSEQPTGAGAVVKPSGLVVGTGLTPTMPDLVGSLSSALQGVSEVRRIRSAGQRVDQSLTFQIVVSTLPRDVAQRTEQSSLLELLGRR